MFGGQKVLHVDEILVLDQPLSPQSSSKIGISVDKNEQEILIGRGMHGFDNALKGIGIRHVENDLVLPNVECRGDIIEVTRLNQKHSTPLSKQLEQGDRKDLLHVDQSIERVVDVGEDVEIEPGGLGEVLEIKTVEGIGGVETLFDACEVVNLFADRLLRTENLIVADDAVELVLEFQVMI